MAVVVASVVSTIAATGEIVGWMKREQTASPVGADPWPCHSSTSGSWLFCWSETIVAKDYEAKKKS